MFDDTHVPPVLSSLCPQPLPSSLGGDITPVSEFMSAFGLSA